MQFALSTRERWCSLSVWIESGQRRLFTNTFANTFHFFLLQLTCSTNYQFHCADSMPVIGFSGIQQWILFHFCWSRFTLLSTRPPATGFHRCRLCMHKNDFRLKGVIHFAWQGIKQNASPHDSPSFAMNIYQIRSIHTSKGHEQPYWNDRHAGATFSLWDTQSKIYFLIIHETLPITLCLLYILV